MMDEYRVACRSFRSAQRDMRPMSSLTSMRERQIKSDAVRNEVKDILTILCGVINNKVSEEYPSRGAINSLRSLRREMETFLQNH